MSTRRCGLALASLEGALYASGGYADQKKCSHSVERYDPTSNAWASVAPMLVPRARHAMAVFNGRLYAIGGYGGSDRLASVESYNPKSNTWETVAPISSKRDYCAAAIMDGDLYVRQY